ncbi:MAG: sulfurtransferase TusA family protein, partial [Candidatus Poseidoniia archaeon]|nr:sulfurtransferase TusA family protein [Candidatus Poseidoniia archaeon]
MTEIQEDRLLDCSGLSCPLPILKTKKTMDGMVGGEVLKMISTDPGSLNDVNASVALRKHLSGCNRNEQRQPALQ